MPHNAEDIFSETLTNILINDVIEAALEDT